MKKQITTILLMMMLLGCNHSGSGAGPTPTAAQFMYVLNSGDDTISQLSIGAAGLATPVSTFATGGNPRAMVMDIQSNYIYVANTMDDTISQFSVGGDGSLTAVAAAIATAGMPISLVVSPNNTSIYSVGLQDSSISQYSIAANGALSFVTTTYFPDLVPMSMVFASSGSFAYVVNSGDNTISQFAVASDGSLNPLTPASVASVGCPSGPVSTVTASGGGEFLHALSCFPSEIEVYAIGSDGTLTFQQSVVTGAGPLGMALSGSNVYTTNGIDSTISMFSIQADGSVQPLAQPTVAAGTVPETLTVDVGGKSAYMIDFATEEIFQYSVATDGGLTLVPTAQVKTGVNPVQILLKP